LADGGAASVMLRAHELSPEGRESLIPHPSSLITNPKSQIPNHESRIAHLPPVPPPGARRGRCDGYESRGGWVWASALHVNRQATSFARPPRRALGDACDSQQGDRDVAVGVRGGDTHSRQAARVACRASGGESPGARGCR
jgi:hypothetical protein